VAYHTLAGRTKGKTAAAVFSSCAPLREAGTRAVIHPASPAKLSILQDVLSNMAPLDMCGGGGGGGSPFEKSPGVDRASCEDAIAKEPNATADTAGDRRRSRALKLRETRSRNAARIQQQQVYTSAAEDSEDEVGEV